MKTQKTEKMLHENKVTHCMSNKDGKNWKMEAYAVIDKGMYMNACIIFSLSARGGSKFSFNMIFHNSHSVPIKKPICMQIPPILNQS